jgi:two-component system cell cycle response regulator CpdR
LILQPDSTTTAMHKILLAEDDNDMRRFLVKALENAGFQVSPHDNGCRPISGCARSRSRCCSPTS